MDELLDIAVLAYRNSKYKDAIELLTQVVDGDKQHWLAWFYLGMSYLKTDESERAYKIMRVIAALCPVEQLRGTAAAVVPSTASQPSRTQDYIDGHNWKTATG